MSLTGDVYVCFDRRTTALTQWCVVFMFGPISLPRVLNDIHLFIYFLESYRLEPNYNTIFRLSLQKL